MRFHRPLVLLLSGLLLTACAAGLAGQSATPRQTSAGSLHSLSPSPTLSPSPSPTGSVAGATGQPREETLLAPFKSARFGRPTTISNRWFPRRSGMRWVFEGQATVDGKLVKRRVELTITDLVKKIGGVPSVVGFELDYNDGALVESELIFWAQDDGGTVWLMGEYPEAIENGEIVETPAWLHGLEDASAGIIMPANPAALAPSYSQGWGPAVGWNDRGKTFEVDSITCVPFDCYDDVLVIDEFNVDEPDSHQLKYYAPNVGSVRVGWAGAREEEREVLELVDFEVLDAAGLARWNAAALAQDKRGYQQLPELYGSTAPAA